VIHGTGLDAWRQNPFFVLEVPTKASRSEVERSGQKLLLLLEMGNKSAQLCQTPLGPIERDADLVRGALSTLRDPEARAVWELWANTASASSEQPASSEQDAIAAPGEAPRPWLDARRAVGWRR